MAQRTLAADYTDWGCGGEPGDARRRGECRVHPRGSGGQTSDPQRLPRSSAHRFRADGIGRLLLQQGFVAVFPTASAFLLFWPGLAVTIAVAALSWYLVEKPALGLKRRLIARS